jgi:hypoxanthine phosphoribosyltransferase
MKKIYLTWNDIETAIESLAHVINKSDIKIDNIMGLPRGGMVPAVMLSHRLNIPLANTHIRPMGNLLVVDDICDSGKTLNQFKFESQIYTATIHHKQTACYEPTFWYGLIRGDAWIVYPWERKDSDTIQDYLK